ncbi:hypothetical protein, partial [Streptomyces sp. NPDC058579]|uniref:hypothetical protein n=1 Tax=Streptomyces sp. NPDC058579 TaxID=3346548 RepID=UPI00364FC10B
AAPGETRGASSFALPEEEGRLVFRTSPTSWLVGKSRFVRHERASGPIKHSRHLRVSVAKLVPRPRPTGPSPPGDPTHSAN